MRIALAQMNSFLGDFSGNRDKILEMAIEASEKRCDLVVFPELCTLGYHPFDLMERPSVIDQQKSIIDNLVEKLPKNIHCLVGAVTLNNGKGKPYFNSALLIHDGEIKKTFSKELLPVYDVFDDSRHFSPGDMSHNHFEINGKKIQVLICEDMWGWDDLHERNPILELKPENTDFIVNLSASPFTLEKRELRLKHARSTAALLKAPLAYVNMVGAQDELVYDGGAFAIDRSGQVIAQNAYYVEDLNVVDFTEGVGGMRALPPSDTSFLHQTLVLGIRDFMAKVGMKRAHIGLSGGIDSALVACLIADAIGPQNLTTIAMPSQFNSPESLSLAEQLAKNLGCHFYTLPIQESYECLLRSFEDTFNSKEFSLMNENLQSRIRGMFLMAYSNREGSLLLNTSNKSEFAVGYSTLYGDMCGGLAPIGDLLKHQVYELCHYYNKDRELIPAEIIQRAPSAELNFNQKDSDSLPAYDDLDQSVAKLVNDRHKAENQTDNWVLNRLYWSEFKRWQSPPILKVSDHAFGQGRRMPIAHRARS